MKGQLGPTQAILGFILGGMKYYNKQTGKLMAKLAFKGFNKWDLGYLYNL